MVQYREVRGPAPLPPLTLLAARRARLLELLGDDVAVIPAAPELIRSRDTDVRFRQSSDLRYLTAFPEPEAVAVISPHTDAGPLTLFVRPRAPEREAWTGARIGVERAAEMFGADAVYPISDLPGKLPELVRPATRIHYPVGIGGEVERLVTGVILAARGSRPRTGVGPIGVEDLDVLTAPLRIVKDTDELDRMRVAAEIGAAGHLAAMRHVRRAEGEWELQAALEAEFLAKGAETAFPSIVGSGENATVLHYVENRRRWEKDDLVLIDAGAEWGMYCSDITRTFPASGKFTGVQRDLYDLVLASEEAAIAAVRPGASFADPHEAAVCVLVRGMLDLGILSGDESGIIESGEYKRFYLHQTSHWLGLDVHDAGAYRDRHGAVILRPGMVLTIEPGIYLPLAASGVPERLRGIGIRIEDDVVVTETGREILTREVPVDPSEIELIIAGG